MEYEEQDAAEFEQAFPGQVAEAKKKAVEIGWGIDGFVFELASTDKEGGEAQWYHMEKPGTIYVCWDCDGRSNAEFQED